MARKRPAKATTVATFEDLVREAGDETPEVDDEPKAKEKPKAKPKAEEPNKKCYICKHPPGLTISGGLVKAVKFVDGFFETSDPDQQALIERNDLFGHAIMVVEKRPVPPANPDSARLGAQGAKSLADVAEGDTEESDPQGKDVKEGGAGHDDMAAKERKANEERDALLSMRQSQRIKQAGGYGGFQVQYKENRDD